MFVLYRTLNDVGGGGGEGGGRGRRKIKKVICLVDMYVSTHLIEVSSTLRIQSIRSVNINKWHIYKKIINFYRQFSVDRKLYRVSRDLVYQV